MKKNENNFVKSPNSVIGRLINGIKSSLKKPSKKAFIRMGLFLVFGMMVWNLNLGFKIDHNVIVLNLNVNNIEAADGDFTTEFVKAFKGRYKGSTTEKIVNFTGDTIGGAVLWAFNRLLYSVLWVISQLLMISGGMLDFALSVESLRELIRTGQVYKLWAVVRDMLNMFFMLLLLFSAFATIFQVEKYHIRKIIIMLIVMALLVNFSYPIALFIIDFSNSAMEFLLDAAFGSDEAISESAQMSKFIKFGETVKQTYDEASFFSMDTTGSLIFSIILVFLYFVTLAALAINLLIRAFAFIVLVILSPIGFACAFFPGTQKLSNDWWDSMLKYAFMGPMLAFFLMMVSVLFAGGELGNETQYEAATIPLHIVGIIFLWMGLKFSNDMGGAASGAAMNFAKKTGNNIKSYGQKAAWSGAVATGVPGAAKARWAQFTDGNKSKAEARAAKIGNVIGVKGAKEKDIKRRAEEYKKNLAQPDELKDLAKKGDAAAAYRLAEDKDMDQKTYDEFMDKNKDDSLRKAINSKTKQARMDLVAVNTAETTLKDAKKLQEFKDKNQNAANMNPGEIKKLIIEQEMGKLGAEDYANQDWKAVSEQVDALTKKGKTADATIIKDAVLKSFNDLTLAAKNETQKRLNGQKAGVLRTSFNVVIV